MSSQHIFLPTIKTNKSYLLHNKNYLFQAHFFNEIPILFLWESVFPMKKSYRESKNARNNASFDGKGKVWAIKVQHIRWRRIEPLWQVTNLTKFRNIWQLTTEKNLSLGLIANLYKDDFLTMGIWRVVGFTAKTMMVERITDASGAAADIQNNFGFLALCRKKREILSQKVQ